MGRGVVTVRFVVLLQLCLQLGNPGEGRVTRFLIPDVLPLRLPPTKTSRTSVTLLGVRPRDTASFLCPSLVGVGMGRWVSVV